MQPFPPESDLKIFAGDSIAQVRLDPYGVQFAFESGNLLVAEHGLEQIEPNEGKQSYDCVSKAGPPLLLHRLLYRRIQAVRRADLSLTFEIEGGSSLTVFSELGQYESGNISGPDYPFTVF